MMSAAAMDSNLENNSNFVNISRSVTFGPTSKAINEDEFEHQLDIATVSSFDGELTGMTYAMSSFFDSGSVITGSVNAISPIQVRTSPFVDEITLLGAKKTESEFILDEVSVNDKPCSICPIC